MVAMQLTGAHDRGAIEAWIEGHADRKETKELLASLAGFQQGHGLLWVPRDGILKTMRFPANVTFDSSRTPRRGEKKRDIKLKPLNLDKLKERLASVEAETKANDPAALKREIADLQAQLRKVQTSAADPAAIAAAEARGFATGYRRGAEEWHAKGFSEGWIANGAVFLQAVEGVGEKFARAAAEARRQATKTIQARESGSSAVQPPASTPIAAPAPILPRASNPSPAASGDGRISPRQQTILDAIAWMASLGSPEVDKGTVAFLADASPTSSAYANNLGAMRSAGLIDYPTGGMVALTTEGQRLAVTRLGDDDRGDDTVLHDRSGFGSRPARAADRHRCALGRIAAAAIGDGDRGDAVGRRSLGQSRRQQQLRLVEPVRLGASEGMNAGEGDLAADRVGPGLGHGLALGDTHHDDRATGIRVLGDLARLPCPGADRVGRDDVSVAHHRRDRRRRQRHGYDWDPWQPCQPLQRDLHRRVDDDDDIGDVGERDFQPDRTLDRLAALRHRLVDRRVIMRDGDQVALDIVQAGFPDRVSDTSLKELLAGVILKAVLATVIDAQRVHLLVARDAHDLEVVDVRAGNHGRDRGGRSPPSNEAAFRHDRRTAFAVQKDQPRRPRGYRVPICRDPYARRARRGTPP